MHVTNSARTENTSIQPNVTALLHVARVLFLCLVTLAPSQFTTSPKHQLAVRG
jgi:hypothetical protein